MSFLFYQPFEPALYARGRRFAPLAKITATPSFNAARRQMATLAAWPEDAWRHPPRRFGGVGYIPPNGRSASFTLSFTGRGDDPYADAGLGAAAATGPGSGPGQALAADPTQALAVQTSGNFTGASASRRG